MIEIKSNREIELMKEACRVAALAHKAIAEAIKPGISTLELDKIAEKGEYTLRAVITYTDENDKKKNVIKEIQINI